MPQVMPHAIPQTHAAFYPHQIMWGIAYSKLDFAQSWIKIAVIDIVKPLNDVFSELVRKMAKNKYMVYAESGSPQYKHLSSAFIPYLKSSSLVTIILCKNLKLNSLSFISLEFFLNEV